jgi:uncharacterized protein
MLAELPERIDPWRLARQHQILRGELPLAEMTRLRESVVASEGHAQLHWAFGVDAEQRFFIQGEVTAEVVMVCQRCLQNLRVPLRAHTRLIVLKPSQQDEDLASEWEPLFVTETPLLLRVLVEDELLLALPIVPRHEVCPRHDYRAEDDDEAARKPNPFAVLAQLKK